MDLIVEPSASLQLGALLFVDMSGFTKLSEKLSGQGAFGIEQLSKHLNAYFGPITNMIEECGGDVLKYAGDAVLCLFGGSRLPNPYRATRTNETDREIDARWLSDLTLAAVQCAQQIHSKFDNWQAAPGVMLRTHSAVACGNVVEIIVGGSQGNTLNESVVPPNARQVTEIHSRFEFMVAGEPLEQLRDAMHESHSGDIVLSEAAHRATKHVLRSSAIEGSRCVKVIELQRVTEHPLNNAVSVSMTQTKADLLRRHSIPPSQRPITLSSPHNQSAHGNSPTSPASPQAAPPQVAASPHQRAALKNLAVKLSQNTLLDGVDDIATTPAPNESSVSTSRNQMLLNSLSANRSSPRLKTSGPSLNLEVPGGSPTNTGVGAGGVQRSPSGIRRVAALSRAVDQFSAISASDDDAKDNAVFHHMLNSQHVFDAACFHFVPSSVVERLRSGQKSWLLEHRNITVCFISLPVIEQFSSTSRETIKFGLEKLQSVVADIFLLCSLHDGDVRQLIQDDKGLVIILVFGLSASDAHPALRAVQTCSAIVRELSKRFTSSPLVLFFVIRTPSSSLSLFFPPFSP